MKKGNIIKAGVFVAMMSLTIIPVLGSTSDGTGLDIDTIESNIIADNIELERYRDEIMVAEYEVEKADDEVDNGGSGYYEMTMYSDYYPLEADNNYDYAYYGYYETVDELILSAEENYYTYLLLEEEIALQEAKIERLNNELKDLELKVELGVDKESAVADKELAIDSEELSLGSLVYEKDCIVLELNVLMGGDMTNELVLEAANIPFEEYVCEDLESLITEQLEENGELVYMNGVLELYELEQDIYDDASSSDTYDDEIEALYDSIFDQEADVADQEVTVEYNIRSSYNSLLNQYDQIRITELAINTIELDVTAAEKRYELGLTTSDVLLELEESLAFEELNLEKAKLEYYLAVEVFKNLTD